MSTADMIIELLARIQLEPVYAEETIMLYRKLAEAINDDI